MATADGAIQGWVGRRACHLHGPTGRVGLELAGREPWSEVLHDIPFRTGKVVETPVRYAELLTDAGCRVDAWETTYLHQLTGENAVLNWITGTALTPVRDRLDDDQWQEFRSELIPMLDEVYPARADGMTYFPFRRIFVVAQVVSGR